jgi:hypothetical protein
MRCRAKKEFWLFAYYLVWHFSVVLDYNQSLVQIPLRQMQLCNRPRLKVIRYNPVRHIAALHNAITHAYRAMDKVRADVLVAEFDSVLCRLL